MTYPGPDSPQPGQQPGQPGQPGQPFQQGQPGQPWQQGQPGQTGQPWQPGQPWQQGQPAGAWAPPQGPGGPGQPQKKSSVLKRVVLPVVGGLAVLAAAGAAFGLVGGDPEVGDCVRMVGAADFESVDCGSDEAEFRIVGIDDQELDRAEFDATDVCLDFETSEVALWIGADESEPGTVYCAEPL